MGAIASSLVYALVCLWLLYGVWVTYGNKRSSWRENVPFHGPLLLFIAWGMWSNWNNGRWNQSKPLSFHNVAPVSPPPSYNLALSAGDLAFGRQQVDQMMRDRPQMTTVVTAGDLVYQWAVRQFAGEANGQHIYWSSQKPDCPSWCLSITHVEGYLAIRKQYAEGPQSGHDLSGEKLWECAVYEIYNMSQSQQFLAIDEAARSSQISKPQYILACAKLEFGTNQKTKAFYRLLWGPLVDKKSQVTNEADWLMDAPDTFEKWMEQFQRSDAYPYGYYGTEYDQRIAPYMKR